MAQWLAGKATHMFEVPGGAEGKKGKKARGPLPRHPGCWGRPWLRAQTV